MRTGRNYACLALSVSLLVGVSLHSSVRGARAAEVGGPGASIVSPAEATASGSDEAVPADGSALSERSSPSAATDDIARQLPAIEPAPAVFEHLDIAGASDPVDRPAAMADLPRGESVADGALGSDDAVAASQATAPEASPETTGGIEKIVPAAHAATPASASPSEPAFSRVTPDNAETLTEPVVAPEAVVRESAKPAAEDQAAAKPLDARPDAGISARPSVNPSALAVLSSHASSTPPAEQPASANAAAAGGAIYGPDLPDAALAKAILARLGSAKGGVDLSIAEFYAARANRPVWIKDEALTSSARSGLVPLERASEDGLKADAYLVRVTLDTLDHQADTELALTRAMVRYARDARGARINPRRISPLITAEPTIPDTAAILDTLVKAEAAGPALLDFQPHQPGYLALKAKLADLRAMEVGFDRRQAFEEGELVANMERWRWLPRDLGATYIMVNVPEFKLEVVRDGVVIHQTKVIVGKPQTPTPIFSHPMEYLIVNPYWNIPPSIALKEMLPQLKRDPLALQKKGFEIVRGGHEVDPSTVDWTGSIRNIRIRQPPGERNALGFIKFMFPNDHAVYLHDTPSRGLFASTVRAFSHGCVRVFEPFGLAEILLADQSGITAKQLRAMIGKGERTINLTSRIPVHIAYFTSFVDQSGTLQSRADIYGHSAKVRAALGYGS